MRSKADLYSHQQRTVTRLYEHDATQAIIPMGGGKTAASLTAFRELQEAGEVRKGIIMAPKRVAQLVWPKEIHHWDHLADLRVSLVSGTPKQRIDALGRDADLYVIGIDNAQWMVELVKGIDPADPLFDLLCIDELSRFKNPASKRGRALQKIVERWDIKWGLTGTPRPNGIMDQFLPLSLLTNGELWGKSFYQWRRKNFYPTDWNQYNWEVLPNKEPDLIRDINSVSVTIGLDDMPDLPELKEDEPHWVELPGKVRDLYKRMERDLIAELKSGDITAANMAVATGKLSQIVQGFLYDEDGGAEPIHELKLEALDDIAGGINGSPLLIGYEFLEDLARIKRLFPSIPHLGRGTTDAQAEEYEAAWNRGELPFLALHPASAGHGLNLQHGGAHLAWYGLPWSAELYDQTVKRFHRPGQTRRCFSIPIMARGTVDELKFERVRNKITEQEAFRLLIDRV